MKVEISKQSIPLNAKRTIKIPHPTGGSSHDKHTKTQAHTGRLQGIFPSALGG